MATTDHTPRDAARRILNMQDVAPTWGAAAVTETWNLAPIVARAMLHLLADNAELRRGVIFEGDWDGNSNPPTCGICLATAAEADDIAHGDDCPAAPRDEDA